MKIKLKSILKIFFIVVISGLLSSIIFNYYTSSEQRLKRQLIKDFACSSNAIKIQRIDPAFKIEVHNKPYVYIECGCCDEEWFDQCKPASDKYWIKLCDSEVRYCIDKCMEARKLAGFDDYSNSNIICKEIDDANEQKHNQ